MCVLCVCVCGVLGLEDDTRTERDDEKEAVSESESDKSDDEDKPPSEHEQDAQVDETHFIEDATEDLALVCVCFLVVYC